MSCLKNTDPLWYGLAKLDFVIFRHFSLNLHKHDAEARQQNKGILCKFEERSTALESRKSLNKLITSYYYIIYAQ